MAVRGDLLDRRWMWGALLLAAALPLIWPPIPPLIDLLGHMGRYKVELDGATEPALVRGFAFEWRLIGNLGIDLLIIPFGRLFGIELGTKLIVLAIPLIAASGMIWLSREVHGRVSPALPIAVALIYGYPFHFGFINFALSSALVFHALALWLRLGRQDHRKLRAALFIVIAPLLWVTHLVGWGLLGLCVFGAETVLNRRAGQAWIRSAFSAGLTCLPLALPLVLMILTWSSSPRAGSGDFLNFGAKLFWMTSLLRDRWHAFDIACATLVYLVLAGAGFDKRVRYDALLGVPALLCVAAFILMPRIAVGSAYADMRLLPFTCSLALLAIVPREGAARGMALAALAFLSVRTAATTASLFLYSQAYSRELEALEAVPRGASVLSLVSRPCRWEWTTPREEHLPSLAIVRRAAFTNDQWSIDNAQLITVRQPGARQYGQDPSQIVFPDHCRDGEGSKLPQAAAEFNRAAFDYVWTINGPPGAFPAPDVRLVWSNGRSALYRVDKIATSDTPAGSGTRPTR